jgi:hypothetical protein
MDLRVLGDGGRGIANRLRRRDGACIYMYPQIYIYINRYI